MSKPIAPAKGIAFAFPDVCNTRAPPAPPMPIPYPNIAQLKDAKNKSDINGKELLIGGDRDHVLLENSTVSTSSGNEAGSSGGVKSGSTKGALKIMSASKTVFYGPEKKGIVRFMDGTKQNDENAVGFILSSFPSVLVGD